MISIIEKVRDQVITANAVTPSMNKLLKILRTNRLPQLEPDRDRVRTTVDQYGCPVIIFEGSEFVRFKSMSTGEEKWKCKAGNCPAYLRTVGTGASLIVTATENIENHVLRHLPFHSSAL